MISDVRSAVGRGLQVAFFALLALMLLGPMLIVIGVSLNRGALMLFPPSGLSLRWYSQAWPDSFTQGLWLSLEVGILTAALAVAIGLPTAFFISRSKGRGVLLVRVLSVAPLAIPEVMLGLGLSLLFTQWLPINVVMQLVLGHSMIALPVAVQLLSAGIAHLNPDISEAAAVLGAGPLRRFVEVTLRSIAPSLAGAALLSFLVSFDQVTISLFLATPGVTTLPIELYSYIDTSADPLVAATSSSLIVFGVVAFLIASRLNAFLTFGARNES